MVTDLELTSMLQRSLDKTVADAKIEVRRILANIDLNGDNEISFSCKLS